jgi:hypothetical protein
VALVQRDGSPLRPGRSVLLSASWGAGAFVGVALGAVLSAVSGSGAPGLQDLDLSAELGWWPLLVGGGVLAAHLLSTLAVAFVRGQRSRGPEAQGDHEDEGRSDDDVDRQVGSEVPASQG